MSYGRHVVCFVVSSHTQKKRSVNYFQEQQAFAIERKNFNTVTAISLKLLSVPCKISSYRVDFGTRKNKRTGRCREYLTLFKIESLVE